MTATQRNHLAASLKEAIVWRAWIDDARAGQIYAGEMPVREILGTERFLAEAACATYTALTHAHPMVRFRALCKALHYSARNATDPLIAEALEAAKEDLESLLAGFAS